jgi:hypothetical protein
MLAAGRFGEPAQQIQQFRFVLNTKTLGSVRRAARDLSAFVDGLQTAVELR